jgi:hypothetical protein
LLPVTIGFPLGNKWQGGVEARGAAVGNARGAAVGNARGAAVGNARGAALPTI